jgi:glycosyltransferase involved in cell wall biosynthesis
MAVLSLRDLPLFEDALPSKLLEYMAAGRPVVASAAGDVARLLERSQGGIASKPGDAAGLAQSIRDLAANPDRARQLGASGRQYVVAHYSREAFVDRLEQIMDRVTGIVPAPAGGP